MYYPITGELILFSNIDFKENLSQTKPGADKVKPTPKAILKLFKSKKHTKLVFTEAKITDRMLTQETDVQDQDQNSQQFYPSTQDKWTTTQYDQIVRHSHKLEPNIANASGWAFQGDIKPTVTVGEVTVSVGSLGGHYHQDSTKTQGECDENTNETKITFNVKVPPKPGSTTVTLRKLTSTYESKVEGILLTILKRTKIECNVEINGEPRTMKVSLRKLLGLGDQKYPINHEISSTYKWQEVVYYAKPSFNFIRN